MLNLPLFPEITLLPDWLSDCRAAQHFRFMWTLDLCGLIRNAYWKRLETYLSLGYGRCWVSLPSHNRAMSGCLVKHSEQLWSLSFRLLPHSLSHHFLCGVCGAEGDVQKGSKACLENPSIITEVTALACRFGCAPLTALCILTRPTKDTCQSQRVLLYTYPSMNSVSRIHFWMPQGRGRGRQWRLLWTCSSYS